jgi:hypothetical protein
MRRLPPDQLALMISQYLILAGLAVRVVMTGLYRRYPYFFGYLLVGCAQGIVFSFYAPDSLDYVYPWMISQALLTCFSALIVLELYGLVLRDLVGLASLLRRYIKICIAFSIVASSLPLWFEQIPHNLTPTFMVIDRAVVSSLLVFVLLLTAFLVYYPIRINRNVVVYSIGYAFYFTAKAAGLFVINVKLSGVRQIGLAVVTACAAASLFWLIGLRHEDEPKKLVIGHLWNREDQDQILARINALNAMLLRRNRDRNVM